MWMKIWKKVYELLNCNPTDKPSYTHCGGKGWYEDDEDSNNNDGGDAVLFSLGFQHHGLINTL